MASTVDTSRHRFSGYQLPKIQLDETGHSYYLILGVHPYYTSQPMWWQAAAFTTTTPAIGDRRIYKPTSGGSGGGGGSTSTTTPRTKNNKLYCMMKIS